MNQRESETEVKTLEKRKNDNQIYYQQNKKKNNFRCITWIS